MKTITYFKAYKAARDRMSFYQSQKGGDYSQRIKKVNRQAEKFEERVYQCIETLITLAIDARPFVADMVGIASFARFVLPFIDEVLKQEGCNCRKRQPAGHNASSQARSDYGAHGVKR